MTTIFYMALDNYHQMDFGSRINIDCSSCQSTYSAPLHSVCILILRFSSLSANERGVIYGSYKTNPGSNTTLNFVFLKYKSPYLHIHVILLISKMMPWRKPLRNYEPPIQFYKLTPHPSTDQPVISQQDSFLKIDLSPPETDNVASQVSHP